MLAQCHWLLLGASHINLVSNWFGSILKTHQELDG